VLDDDLIICRCEEITLGEIRKAIREGARDIVGIRRRTRAGMGLCQGRTCESLVLRILARELDEEAGRLHPNTARPPVLPVTFGVLAGESYE
jgi:NAD(P)H-nitrite reductase